jgi:hypothetical protein
MEESERQLWPPNITVRTQIAAFLGGTFFAVLLLYVSQDRMRSLFQSGDRLTIFTVLALTITFTAFAFSAFALGLSADLFRKSIQENSTEYKKKAITAFDVGGDFFKIAYLAMLASLFGVLAHIDFAMGVIGALIFIFAWAYLVWKTYPYKTEKKNEEKTEAHETG